MSKKQKTREIAYGLSWGYGYAISQDLVETIIGKTLTLIESCGMPDKQEEAVKSLVRQSIRNTLYEDSVSLSPETFSELKEKNWEAQSKARITGTPPVAI